jgi:hypothetical protein
MTADGWRVEASRVPFPHAVADGLFDARELDAGLAAWPGPGWDGWFRYPPEQGSKLAGRPAVPLPPALGLLLWRMALLPAGHWLGLPGPLLPDLGLYGAGLHELPAGRRLPAHLDSDRHALLGLGRAATLALYLGPWRDGWGGELCLGPGSVVPPAHGRLVCFANGDDSRHLVEPVAGPLPRRSLALFLYGPAPPGPGTRPRALWL